MYGMVQNSFNVNVSLNGKHFFNTYIDRYQNRAKTRFIIEEIKRAFTEEKGYEVKISEVTCYSTEIKEEQI